MRPAIPTMALVATLAAAPDVDAQQVVRWKNRDHELTELPKAMTEPALAAIETWAPWADEHGYRLDLEDGGRVLLVSPRKGGAWKQMRHVDRAIGAFEAALPAPARLVAKIPERSAPATPAGQGGGGPLPEDPEGPPPGIGGLGGLSGGTEAETKSAAPPPPALDAETIVFFVVADEKDYAQLAARLAWDHPYLAGWAKTAKQSTGFTLEQPLAGAYVAGASGQEEWNPDNEIVHRIGELLLIRRFGRQPFWIQQGWAWHLEESLLRGIYCFPYRDEFVFATEHTAWPNELRREFKDRDEPLTIDDLAFPRGKYDGERARRAFGAARFLAERRRGKFAGALEQLRVARLERADGGEVPPADQERILKDKLGADVLDEMAKAFARGKDDAE